MSNLLEVLITCDSNNTLWTSSIWDPHNGTNLITYKGGGTAENRTACFIGSDYLAAVEKTKPILHIWPLNSQQTVQGMRFILPGKATAFAVTPDGSYCIAGIDEKIYLWQIASGNLLTIINRHYQKVNLLKFTSDGRFFVSAAEDGMVMVWSLVTVAANPEVELVTQTVAGQHNPVYIFSDHFLPVTDMCISKTGIHGRLFTVSSDRTCKIYDLTSGEMLLNLVFDEPLSAIVLDVLELNAFVGSTEGRIVQFSLTNPPRGRDILVNDDKNIVFSAHTKAVSCLSVSLNGELLMSGGNDEQVILWHIRSQQPIRVIKHKGPITNAFFTLNHRAIFKQDFTPSIILHNLERTLENNSDEIVEIEVLVNKKNNFWPQYISNIDNQAAEIDLDTKHREAMLKDELEKMKRINSNLYAVAIEKALKSEDSPKKKIKNKTQ
ncbi:WD repeat-containing protein 18 [Maniola jurtina]|uniref:WD repeat-containing protein 18 n=1 Tax=Maniola jurtina TaxID=191418 RepID=UPI001E68BFD4|nr:WD repeat-containing protein 18 [Maniola jurtina]